MELKKPSLHIFLSSVLYVLIFFLRCFLFTLKSLSTFNLPFSLFPFSIHLTQISILLHFSTPVSKSFYFYFCFITCLSFSSRFLSIVSIVCHFTSFCYIFFLFSCLHLSNICPVGDNLTSDHCIIVFNYSSTKPVHC